MVALDSVVVDVLLGSVADVAALLQRGAARLEEVISVVELVRGDVWPTPGPSSHCMNPTPDQCKREKSWMLPSV